METPRSGCNYITPGISLEVRSRASSLERTTNNDSASTAASRQEGSTPLNPLPENLDVNSIDGMDI